MENADKKKIAVMQPYVFPYLGYFQLIGSVDTFVFFDDVNYINKGWVNRNNILLSNQQHLFTIPLSGASQNALISEIKILQERSWKVKFLKTLETAYRKAPFFNVIFSMVSDWIMDGPELIAEFNFQTTKEICEYTGVSTTLVRTSSVYNNRELKGQERVLDICKQEKADVYINPIGGVALYDSTLFAENNMELFFLKTEFTPYQQHSENFVTGLSILDYLMFLSPEEIAKKLKEFTLVTNTNATIVNGKN
jgi:hypothetical protein